MSAVRRNRIFVVLVAVIAAILGAGSAQPAAARAPIVPIWTQPGSTGDLVVVAGR